MTHSKQGTTKDTTRTLELDFELPGSPEEVWAAIATGPGIEAWFVPSEVEEREGGTIVMHLGPGESSTGTITAWDPPRRFASELDAFAAFAGALGLGDAAVEQRTKLPPGAPSFSGIVERVDKSALTVRLDEPAPGYALVSVYRFGSRVAISLRTYLFGPKGRAAVASDEAAWRSWMEEQFPVSG